MATNQPTGLQVVTDSLLMGDSSTTGFVETKGGRGVCFEWYRLVDGKWKATHILHEENWMLNQATPDPIGQTTGEGMFRNCDPKLLGNHGK